MYARSRVTPTDPKSTRQQLIRALFGAAASYWSNTLTTDQRDAWSLYGSNTAMTNRLGETIYLSGQQHFIRANTPRMQAGINILAAAPTNFDLGTFTTPTISSADDSEAVQVAYNNGDAWANDTGGYLLLFGGKPQNASVNFFKGPWRYMGKESGAAVPPTSPVEGTSGYALTAGQRLWVMVRCIQVDGRLSGPVLIGPHTVTAAA
jgi:hypothetical protein